MNAAPLTQQQADKLRVQRWTLRAFGFGVLMLAGCAWLVRDQQPFLPAFALQSVAAFVFVGLILAAVWIGFVVGVFVGKLNGFLGAIVGLLVGAAIFLFVGIGSTEIPVLGPAIERIVSLIE